MRYTVYFLFICCSYFISAQNLTLDAAQDLFDNSKYSEIDAYVRICPKSTQKDPDQLVSYFEEIAETDL